MICIVWPAFVLEIHGEVVSKINTQNETWDANKRPLGRVVMAQVSGIPGAHASRLQEVLVGKTAWVRVPPSC